jgi:signal transduction histidine kinase
MGEAAFLKNWDLLALGTVIILTAILGFTVYFKNPKSSTSRSFLGFAIFTALWGVCNYLSYHVQPPALAFAFLKLTVFAVVWQTYFFLKFSVVFPGDNGLPRHPLWFVLRGIVVAVAVLTLTPFVFERIGSVSPDGTIAEVVNGPAIPLFGMMSVGLTAAGVMLLLRKTLRRMGNQENPYHPISIGVLLMFALIITSNFILPVFFNNAQYIQLGVLFVFPFVLLTSYAIIRNKIFNVKVVSAELFIAALLILSVLQLVQSQTIGETFVRAGTFVSLLGVGILLIKSVLREVEQREELERLAKQLREANAKLEDLSRFKTQLLSLASHQIRSPLAAIKGFAQLVIDGSYGQISDKAKESVGKMRQSADGLIDLINTLLDLRKVEEGKMEYQFAKTDMVRLVRDTFEGLRPLAVQKGLEFTLKVPDGELAVNADAQKLKQVFQNLIDNAIKYTPSGSVAVELYEAAGGAVMFAVRDTGLGFAPELAPHLFEEFVRDERVKKQILGTGLGLFIARKIIEAHGGKLWAESKGLQKGSAFFVALKKIL